MTLKNDDLIRRDVFTHRVFCDVNVINYKNRVPRVNNEVMNWMQKHIGNLGDKWMIFEHCKDPKTSKTYTSLFCFEDPKHASFFKLTWGGKKEEYDYK